MTDTKLERRDYGNIQTINQKTLPYETYYIR